jgi:hypothetical protein
VHVTIDLNFVDLVNLSLVRTSTSDRHPVRMGANSWTHVTAGEAQVIAEAWNRIADEIVERDRGAA